MQRVQRRKLQKRCTRTAELNVIAQNNRKAIAILHHLLDDLSGQTNDDAGVAAGGSDRRCKSAGDGKKIDNSVRISRQIKLRQIRTKDCQ
jgi:hypothetical protein